MTAAGLDRHRYMSLATFRRSGAPVATPVWFAAVDGRLYVVSAGNAGKVKRIRNGLRARVAPCDMRGGVTGPWQDATARVVTDGALIERAQAALRAKYGWQVAIFNFVSRLTGRARRRAWVEVTPASP
ncbi:MAG TPA: PPOX class F420-dependent oxidoreductase [Candidatus Binatia bacterium]|nr:PPOX class F420-dependent oxidoreductase [Candidatus Binatia bacterium]